MSVFVYERTTKHRMPDGSICDHCGKYVADHLLIIIFKTGLKVQYTVTSFPMFTMGLCEIKLQFLHEGEQSSELITMLKIA